MVGVGWEEAKALHYKMPATKQRVLFFKLTFINYDNND